MWADFGACSVKSGRRVNKYLTENIIIRCRMQEEHRRVKTVHLCLILFVSVSSGSTLSVLSGNLA